MMIAWIELTLSKNWNSHVCISFDEYSLALWNWIHRAIATTTTAATADAVVAAVLKYYPSGGNDGVGGDDSGYIIV